MVITCKTIRVLSGEHLLDIGRTLLDTEIIGAFFERTHARHHNNRRKTRTYIELSELNVFIGWTLTCIWPQRFKRFALVSPSDLKKCSFDWHLKRVGVLLGGTCETLRQVGPCWLDTCKSFGPNGLYWFHSFYITSRIVFSHSIRCTTETHGIWLLNTHLFTFMNMWQLL